MVPGAVRPSGRIGAATVRNSSRAGRGGADLDKVSNDGLSNRLGERIEISSPGLGTVHAQRFVFPVQVVELQAANLPGTQAVDDQEHQDGPVALLHRTVAVGGSEKALDIGPAQRRAHFLVGIDSLGQDSLSDARCAPAAVFGEADERPNIPGVNPDRYAAVVSPRLFRFDGGVDIRGPQSLKLLAAGGEPVEELGGAAKHAVDRAFGITALGAHPFLESADLDAVGVTILLGLIEPTKEA